MDWIVKFLTNISGDIAISVVAGLVVLIVQIIFTYLKDISDSKRYKAYAGDYYLYCFHTNGSDEIIELNLKIKRRIGKVKAIVKTFNDAYEGRVIFTSGNVYINLSAKNHPENLQIVFFDPLFPVVNKLWGIGSCISVLGEPCALRFLVSRNKLNEQEVKLEFKQQRGIASKHIMLVKKDVDFYHENSKEKLLVKGV